jgi:hypothetical protein
MKEKNKEEEKPKINTLDGENCLMIQDFMIINY